MEHFSITPQAGTILVEVNLSQKKEAILGSNILLSGKNYNDNFRERNPVIAKVVHGCREIPSGCFIVCNYSHFDLESPHYLQDTIYCIPVNEEIYAVVNDDGSLTPVCGNVLVETQLKETKIDIPQDLKKEHTNQGIALTGEYKDQYIFWLPFSNYSICYTWKGKEYKALKIHSTEITGYLKK